MRYRALVATLLLAACTSSAQQQTSSPPASTGPRTSITHTTPPSSTPPSSTPPPIPVAQRVFNRMSERERVGQLLMVDCPSTQVGAATVTAIQQYHVGSVILDGTSYAGLQETRAVTDQLQGLAPDGVRLFVATDQEGGLVQRLQGTGFTRIVSAVQQGTIPPATLRGYARGWGGQLRRAGVNVNLAPVLDTVPSGFGSEPADR